jgi:hypothetical protein
MRHLGVVIIDGVETRFVLQTEHENDRVHPGRELKQKIKMLNYGDRSILHISLNK